VSALPPSAWPVKAQVDALEHQQQGARLPVHLDAQPIPVGTRRHLTSPQRYLTPSAVDERGQHGFEKQGRTATGVAGGSHGKHSSG
jgi:hypothetical protein